MSGNTKHLHTCPDCMSDTFNLIPAMGGVLFQCTRCKRISTYLQLKGGDTSGNPPLDATHTDEDDKFWKRDLKNLSWYRWTVSGWEPSSYPPRDPEPVAEAGEGES